MKYGYVSWFVTCFFFIIGNYHCCQGQPEADDGLLSDAGPRSRPVVVTLPGLGKVQGRRDGPIDFFGGLPYAAPPVGNLRWAPPEVSETTMLQVPTLLLALFLRACRRLSPPCPTNLSSHTLHRIAPFYPVILLAPPL